MIQIGRSPSRTIGSGPIHRGIVHFLGVYLDALTYDEFFDLIDLWIDDKNARSHHVACINAYCVTIAQESSQLKQIYNGADIAGADGMPFVHWIRRVLALPCDRFAAPDIIVALAAAAKERGYTFYLYGGAPPVVVRMKAFLEAEFPHVQIVGYRSPPFRPLTEEEDDQVCAEINALKPDILCVGLGTPKQDYWIEDHLSRIRGTVMVASGATFDFFGGRTNLAPSWIRNSGFEWLHRLFSNDFKRLWKRYTVYNLKFCFHFLLQLARIRIAPGARWHRN